MPKPIVVDIYHDNKVTSFPAAYASGIRGVIHKASQAKADPLYAKRRVQAVNAGMLWGAYHFNTGEKAARQVDRFFSAAEPDENTRMALDYETNVMPFATMIEFLQIADEKLGRRITLYSGNRIKETVIHASQADRDFLALHPFWLAQYGPRAVLLDADKKPLPWQWYDLWQFAADGVPHINRIPGMEPKVDVSAYDGTEQELIDGWAGWPLDPAPAVADEADVAGTGDGADTAAPAPAMRGFSDPSWQPGAAVVQKESVTVTVAQEDTK